MALKVLRLSKLFKYNYRSIKFNNYLSTSTQTAFTNTNTNGTVNDTESQTHFGFDTVKLADKQEKVDKVFQDVADVYDLMNDALSLGIHRLWKDYFINQLNPVDNTKLLDVAGGTGDIAFRFVDNIKDNNLKNCHVTVLDINPEMLKVGKLRSEKLNHNPDNISWIEANAEQLPFPDNTFNAYSIAFGIRNCPRIDKVLSEAYRVLVPGGRFMCLEFSHLNNSTLQWIYDRYSFEVIPVLGQIIAQQWHHYKYLVESIRQFAKPEAYKNMIEQAGFRQVNYDPLTQGIVAIHSGFKL